MTRRRTYAGDMRAFERYQAKQARAAQRAAAAAPSQVWCKNDASRAVVEIDGEGYCATCSVYAAAEAAQAAHREMHGLSPYVDFHTPDYPDITGHPAAERR